MRRHIGFAPRDAPLEPLAAVARGETAIRLADHLLSWDDERLSALRGLTAPALLLVLGAAESLPWVDGIVYLGLDPLAPRLLLPTALLPDVPANLLEQALLRAMPDVETPLAVLPSPRRVLSAAPARRIERPLLEEWRARCS